jgi:hypothetical protein
MMMRMKKKKKKRGRRRGKKGNATSAGGRMGKEGVHDYVQHKCKGSIATSKQETTWGRQKV